MKWISVVDSTVITSQSFIHLYALVAMHAINLVCSHKSSFDWVLDLLLKKSEENILCLYLFLQGSIFLVVMNKDLELAFECADFFLVRFAHLPAGLFSRNQEMVSSILHLYHNNPLIQEAIALASPDLSFSLEALSNKELDPKAHLKLFKYLLRMSSRATPFGLFASTGMGFFGKTTDLQFDINSIKKRVKPDMQWLADVSQTITKNYEIVRHLSVMFHPCAFLRNKRVILEKIKDLYLKREYQSIKQTNAIELLISKFQYPIKYELLEEELGKAFSGFPIDKIRGFLWELFQKGYLISELNANIDPQFILQSFSQILEKAEDTKSAHFFLSAFKKQKNYERSTFGLNTLREAQFIEGVNHQRCFCVDAIQTKPFSLPIEIKTSIEEAANILFGLTTNETPSSLHNFFLKVYGANRLVPLKELIAYEGIDEILSSHQPSHKQLDIVSSFFHEHPSLLKTIQLDKIAPPICKNNLGVHKKPIPSCEIFCEIGMPSKEFNSQCDHKVLITGASERAGVAFGRFNSYWDQSPLCELLKKEEEQMPEILFVDACFVPDHPRSQNISFSKQLRSKQLNLSFHHLSSHSIEIDDIYVGANTSHLYLYSKRVDKEINVILYNLINKQLAPDVLKLILKISEDRFSKFSFSFFSDFKFGPYTPRIEYKNIILSPARWHFHHEAIQVAKSASESNIRSKLLSLLKKHQVPTECFMTHYDHKILIDQRIPQCLDLLVQEFRSKGAISLMENCFSYDELIATSNGQKYVSEFVIPLRQKEFRIVPTNVSQPFLGNRFSKEWSYFKIFVHPKEIEGFICNYLYPYMINTIVDKKWFFIRYKEENHHIRLRVQDSHIMQELREVFIGWKDKQIINDFLLANYEQEIERYGGVEAIKNAENFFCADSQYCCSLLSKMQELRTQFPDYLIASLAIINIFKHFNVIPVLSEDLKPFLSGIRPFRADFLQATRAIYYNINIENHELNKIISVLKKITSPSLMEYADKLNHLSRGKTHVAPLDEVVNSLSHMHCNRFFGPSKELEMKAFAAAVYFSKQIHSSAAKHPTLIEEKV